MNTLLWILGCCWASIFLLIALASIGYTLFGNQPPRSWRQRLRELGLLMLVAVGWPLAVAIGGYLARRERILELACSGVTSDPNGPTTELQWRRDRDAVRLLAGLERPISERKRRLFACACCRRIWDRLTDDRSREAVELAERHADGLADPDEVRLASYAAGAAADVLMAVRELESGAAARAAQDCLSGEGLIAAERASVSHYRSRWKERRAQSELLREIVGDPFHPLPDRHFPAEVVELARAIHDGDQELYPLLADALEEMGEYSAADHCRGGMHVRGCHVVDWVMGWE